MQNNKEPQGFEQQVEALEALVQGMEQGGMSLQDMMASYEKGVALVKQLNAQLENARQRLQVLKDGTLTDDEGTP
ncbi:MAG: exodeoxyribonuclease VII small subunit [Christensenellales bacterium]